MKNTIYIHELFESCLERRSKLLKFKSLYLRGLTGIFACSFVEYDPLNNAFKAVMKNQKYKTLSFEL